MLTREHPGLDRWGRDKMKAWLAGGCILWLAHAVSLAGSGRVVVISPHNEAIRTEFGDAFTRWARHVHGETIQVEWRDIGGTSDNLRFVLSEFEKHPEGIGIDLFFGGGSEPYLVLGEKGLCAGWRVPAEMLAGIPQSFGGVQVYDGEGRWYGAALSSFGILQNRRVQSAVGLPAVDRWEQLADPRLLGWVGAGDPRNSGTMNNMYEAMLQAYGWERGWRLLTELAGNTRFFDRMSSTTAKDAAIGDTAYALAIDFYGFSQIAAVGRTNLTFVLPADFTAISPDGIAILKGAPEMASARRFVEFVLSEAGQKLWFLPKGHPEGPRKYSIERMSVRPDLYRRYRGVSNIEYSPFELKMDFVYDARLAQRRREVVAGLFGALLVDLHADLRDAWRELIRRRRPPALEEAFGRVPITEHQALELAEGAWKRAAERNATKLAWQRWGLDKYARIRRGG